MRRKEVIEKQLHKNLIRYSFILWLLSLLFFISETIAFRTRNGFYSTAQNTTFIATIIIGGAAFLVSACSFLIKILKFKMFLVLLAIGVIVISELSLNLLDNAKKKKTLELLPATYPTTVAVISSSPTNPVTPTFAIKTNSQAEDTTPWGVAKQIDEHEWTMKIGQDSVMGTPQEVFVALNHYRNTKGISSLSWDDNLANYAQSRTNMFNAQGKTDEHAGFYRFLDNGGFETLGFHSLGENSSFGYREQGVHLIEWIYAADPAHDGNQLDSQWTHVGIGISGTATDIVFGGGKY